MPKKTSEKRDAVITIRLPSKLLAAIEHEAQRDRRSIADVIVFAMEDKLGRGSKKGPK